MSHPDISHLVVQESLVMTNQHLRFNLLHCLQNDADNDDQRGSAERHLRIKRAREENRNHGYNRKSDRAHKDNIIEHLRKIIRRRSAWTDTGDKTALLLHIIRHLQRIERNGGIKIREEKDQADINQKTKRILEFTPA